MRTVETMRADARQLVPKFDLPITPPIIDHVVAEWEKSEKNGVTTGPATLKPSKTST